MAQTAGSSSPGGTPAIDKVRRLQRKLWSAAKASPDRRFHALYDRILRGDVLEEAWRRVRANRGAAGIDKVTLADVEAYGVQRMLAELQQDLRQHRYRPAPVLRRDIPKPQGGRRPLGIPTVRDRVAQAACRIVLEPIFEADFLDSSHGYRPKRSTTDALEQVREAFPRGQVFAVEADITDCFGSIDQDKLLEAVSRRVSDRRVLKLLRLWLRAGVMVDGRTEASVAGVPQGGVISPLLANIFLHAVDLGFAGGGHGTSVRYADDLVVMCRTRQQADEALDHLSTLLTGLGLSLNAAKTKVVDLTEGRQGFDFLGCHLRARVSGRLLERGIRRYYLHRWPSQASMKRVRGKVKAMTGRNRAGRDIRMVIRDLNPLLRGWGNHFRTGNAAAKFNQLDSYVWRRLRGLMRKRYGRGLTPQRASAWTRQWFWGHGLHRLRGTVRYPKVSSL